MADEKRYKCTNPACDYTGGYEQMKNHAMMDCANHGVTEVGLSRAEERKIIKDSLKTMNLDHVKESVSPPMTFLSPQSVKVEKFVISLNHGKDTGKVSDGYHTFDELYEHRIALFIALCKQIKGDLEDAANPVWRAKKHRDGSEYRGYFILGLFTNWGDQITYHIPVSYWGEADFAVTLDSSPEFDGHTSEDVIKRLFLI